MSEVQDLRIRQVCKLVTPKELTDRLPVSLQVQDSIVSFRETVNNIIKGKDSRLLAVIGPCSIHDPDSAYEYAVKLKSLSEKVSDKVFILMRSYFEKPRTSIGWKGLIMDPDLDDSCNIEKGLTLARSLLIKITSLGLPVGGEVLDPFVPQYIDDLVSWLAIGARTTESQIHRSLASGLSTAVGFKNNTFGDIEGAINAIKAAYKPASFIGITRNGEDAVVRTTGNDCAHLILRGGQQAPNYYEDDIQRASVLMKEAGVERSILVDCSHGNSRKDPKRQTVVLDSVIDQVIWGQKAIRGFMLESFLNEGSQIPCREKLKYGVSITDPCLGWEDTEQAILRTAERLRGIKK